MASRHFNDATDFPTNPGPAGILYDFNSGARIFVPVLDPLVDPWQITVSDQHTGEILHDAPSFGGTFTHRKKFFIPYRIVVKRFGQEVFRHDYDASGKVVIIRMPEGTIGDTIGWFPYATRFSDRHDCKLVCIMGEKLSILFKDAYPHITFLSEDGMLDGDWQQKAYATYKLFLFLDDGERDNQPTDFQFSGLHRNAGYILGVDTSEIKPRIALPVQIRPITEPYVCIAAQASSQCKYWNNPNGWNDVIEHLKSRGYRVVCIDRNSTWGENGRWNRIPPGAEDQTGERSLEERVNWLRHADFFIGTSSGLSWLAWLVGIPVVMISGFTHPTNEFVTPYRVINFKTCNSCWNDRRLKWDSKDFFWCPLHKGTEREYECSKSITSQHVIGTIERLRVDLHLKRQALSMAHRSPPH